MKLIKFTHIGDLPTLQQMSQQLNVELDSEFGIILIDPTNHIYVVRTLSNSVEGYLDPAIGVTH